jgi:hypothetical protein
MAKKKRNGQAMEVVRSQDDGAALAGTLGAST